MTDQDAKHRVLSVHCYYREPGGEDVVFETETRLLSERGHPLETFVRRNADLPFETLGQKAAAAAQTIWAKETCRELAAVIARFHPDVVHVHNTFQRLSPAVYRTCRSAGVPVVQTLHNYRYGCVVATLFRDGRPCEDCVGRSIAWPGILHGCYRGSRSESAVVASMAAVHRAAGSWRMVNRYLAITPFAKSRFVAMGIPASRIAVKPNFIAPDPGPRPADVEGDYLLYAGRLTVEKGLPLLAQAAARVPEIPLVIAGDGPLRMSLQTQTAELANVSMVGPRSRQEVSELMAGARAVVVPSQWYETFGMVVAEAYARAVPVLATRLGALPDVVSDGETGLLFPAGDSHSLADIMRRAWTSPEHMRRMGVAGRRRFERQYSAEAGYAALSRTYREVAPVGPAR